jgi:aspartate/methionine/tyrosine aminotransferase
MNIETLLAARARSLDVSGIRRIFELGAKLEDPINLSIGQPDFAVPDALKDAAIDAIRADRNGYTLTQGIPELRGELEAYLSEDLGWSFGDETGVLVTSGTSGALMLAFMAMLEAGDEVVIPDPYFLVYPALAEMFGARAVLCDTYPDFRMTAARVEPLLTERTKIVLMNSPSNPAGVVAEVDDCFELLELCRERGVLLISDEIYDAFTFSDARTQGCGRDARATGAAGSHPPLETDGAGGSVPPLVVNGGTPSGLEDSATSPGGPGEGKHDAPKTAGRGTGSCLRCPSPARFVGAEDGVLLVRGFGKTYGCTGWRLGYAAGDRRLLAEMAKFQQYTFVCAPAPLQYGAIAALHTDMGLMVDDYEQRRDLVVERLGAVTEVTRPGGAFYAFVKVPGHLGMCGTEFAQACVEKNLLVIPGGVFSGRDTHLRLSFAAPAAKLEAGLDVLVGMMET